MALERKSLLLIVDDIHLGGGGERVAVNMANHYFDEKWHVEFVSFRSPQKDLPFNLNAAIIVNYLNVKGNKFVQKISAWKRLRALLSIKKYNIILAIGSHPSTILGFLNVNTITIGTEHSHFYHAPKIWNYLRMYAYKRLSAITVLTNEDLPILKRINDNSVVIPNALSTIPEKHSSMNNKRILAVGRMDKYKQFDKLIKVFKKFNEKNSDWRLTIVGEGEKKCQLKKMISSYDLDDIVEIKPYNPNIEYEYLNSSILVSTSNKEGLPMVMIEAQSYGMPIVSYDCKTGPKEIIIDGQNGYLIRLNDERSMVDALLKLTSDDELRKKMSDNAKKDALRFSPEVIYQKWNDLFNSFNKSSI